MTTFSPGRRMLSAGSIATILVAILHTIGNLGPPPSDAPQFLAVREAMMGYRLPLGMGMSPSLWDIQRSLVFTMSVCLVAMGVLGLVVAGARAATGELRSAVAATLAMASAGLTVLYWWYRVPPPLISMGVVTLLFLTAVVTTRRPLSAESLRRSP